MFFASQRTPRWRDAACATAVAVHCERGRAARAALAEAERRVAAGWPRRSRLPVCSSSCVPLAEGQASTRAALCLAREMLGYVSPRADSIFAVQGLGTHAIALAGNDDRSAPS